jgi:hypothetical protein
VGERDARLADNVTRFEVIDEHGRALVRHDCAVELSYQDNGRTLKVFLSAALRGEMKEP